MGRDKEESFASEDRSLDRGEGYEDSSIYEGQPPPKNLYAVVWTGTAFGIYNRTIVQADSAQAAANEIRTTSSVKVHEVYLLTDMSGEWE